MCLVLQRVRDPQAAAKGSAQGHYSLSHHCHPTVRLLYRHCDITVTTFYLYYNATVIPLLYHLISIQILAEPELHSGSLGGEGPSAGLQQGPTAGQTLTLEDHNRHFLRP
jgi:hypothetical protein